MPRARKPIDGLELLSKEEQVGIRKRAREKVDKERKQKAEDALFAQLLDEERAENDPAYEIKRITLNLAGHSDRIMLDGVVYFHGITYDVPKPVFDVLQDVQAQGWGHEEEVGGVNRDLYNRRPRGTTVSPHGVQHTNVVTANRLMGGI